MKNIVIGLIIVVIIGAVIYKVASTKAPSTLPTATVSDVVTATTSAPVVSDTVVDTSKSSFTFTGYGPGKEHDGTFNTIAYNLTAKDGKITGGSVVFDTASIDTKIDGLNKHLQSADFIDVTTYPKATFTIISIDGKNATGTLSFRGVEKQVSFPVTVTDKTYSADFKISAAPFKFKYVGIKDEIRVRFSVVLK